MKELLLNKDAIAINQDYKALPGDATPGCRGQPSPTPKPPPTPPAKCSVTLQHQDSRHNCTLGTSFGCSSSDTGKMWVSDGCRGVFTCNGVMTACGHDGAGSSTTSCACDGGGGDPEAAAGEVW